MKNIVVGLIAFVFSAAPALAEFTAQERAELAKVVNAGVQLTQAQRSLGSAIVSIGASQKALLVPAILRVWNAQNSVMNVLDDAFSAESNGSLTRDEEIAHMKRAAVNLERQRKEAIALISLLNLDSNVTSAIRFLEAASSVGTFDQSLAYTDFKPASYPRMIGPHGDFEISHSALEHMTQYTLHVQFDVTNLWANTSLGASEPLRDFYRNNGSALGLMFRTWGMAGGIVLPDDAAKINADLIAGSGLRPFDFFRVLLEIEYIFNDDLVPNFAGRQMKRGATTFVRAFSDAFTQVVQQLPEAERTAQWTGRHGAVSNTGPNGWAAEFYFDLSDFWIAMDGYGAGVMLFHHIIVGPPPPLPCTECPPPPPACPEFDASMVLVDNTTARAECKARP